MQAGNSTKKECYFYFRLSFRYCIIKICKAEKSLSKKYDDQVDKTVGANVKSFVLGFIMNPLQILMGYLPNIIILVYGSRLVIARDVAWYICKEVENKFLLTMRGASELNNIIIRKENSNDYKNTEYMTLRAFWNIHGPGCNEHYLVHVLREDEAYVKELSRVAELDGKIIGTIMYSKAKVVDGDQTYDFITFGPLCVEPTFHNCGIGKRLLEETIPLAKKMEYPGIIIFGEPDYYPRHGFMTCDNYGITTADGSNFDAFMIYPLDEEKLAEIHGKFYEAEIFEKCNDNRKVEEFTQEFKHPEPLSLDCQWLHKERLGTICEIQKNNYRIKFWEEEINARLKGSFYEKKSKMPVVGDYVTFIYNRSGDSIITSVCERR